MRLNDTKQSYVNPKQIYAFYAEDHTKTPGFQLPVPRIILVSSVNHLWELVYDTEEVRDLDLRRLNGCIDARNLRTALHETGVTVVDGIALYSKWQSSNKLCVYEVVGFTNVGTTYEEHPVNVVYAGENGKIWSRTLENFKLRMTPVESNETSK